MLLSVPSLSVQIWTHLPCCYVAMLLTNTWLLFQSLQTTRGSQRLVEYHMHSHTGWEHINVCHHVTMPPQTQFKYQYRVHDCLFPILVCSWDFSDWITEPCAALWSSNLPSQAVSQLNIFCLLHVSIDLSARVWSAPLSHCYTLALV